MPTLQQLEYRLDAQNRKLNRLREEVCSNSNGGVETDPIFSASPAFSITAPNITSWNNALNITTGDTRYPQLSGSYANPSWVTSLAYSKLTGVPTIPTNADYVDTTTNQTGLAGNKTWAGLHTFSPTLSASAGISIGTIISPTLNATATNDQLFALDINPTYVTNGFGGVGIWSLRHSSAIVPRVNGTINLGASTARYAFVFSNIFDSGTSDLSLRSNSTIGLTIKSSGRTIVQSGGTFADDGVNQLQVTGKAGITDILSLKGPWATYQAVIGTTSQGGRISFVNGTGLTNLLSIGASALTGDGASIISTGSTGLTISNTGVGGALTLAATDATSVMIFSRAGVTAGRIHTSGNWMFQSGGTYTDSGQFFQVKGTTKFEGAVTTSGANPFLNLIGAANTNQTASTDVQDVLINLSRTVQFATGAKTNQRAVVVTAPTYSAVAATNITSAATVAIAGAPIAGTNVTIDSSLALWVQTGFTALSGGVLIDTGMLVNSTSTFVGKITTQADFESTKTAGGLIIKDTATGVRQLIQVTNGVVVVSTAP